MWGSGSWGSQFWGSTSQPTGNYVFDVSGGVLVSGSTRLLLGSCACNYVVVSLSSGGVLVGGSLDISDTSITGGVLVGGNVRVSIEGDPFDGFAAYWLLDESGNGTAGEFRDSTRNGLDGQGGGGTTAWCPSQDSGVACSFSQHFAGKQFISLPADQLTATQPITVSLWAKIDPLVYFKPRTWFSRGYQTTEGDTWTLSLGHSYLNQITASVNTVDAEGEAVVEYATGTTSLERDRWHHVACVWSPGGSLKVYVNGVLQASKVLTEAALQPLSNGSFIGRLNSGATPEGNLQQVALRGSALSAAWLEAEFNSQCDPSFFTIGPEFQL